MNRRGFTIVELLIVITIMGILLTLGVVNLRGSQVSSRDSERRADVETIAIHLEKFYASGMPSSPSAGRYPSAGFISKNGEPFILEVLDGINPKAIRAPGIAGSNISLIAATNNTATIGGVLPQPTINQYVYQPLQSNRDLCTLGTQECRKFNLFYRTETDNLVRMITSKNQ